MASNITFPNEWDDEERMHYIMSPFPPDYQPPLSDPKVTFWKDLIISSCRDMHKWSFTLNEITERLRWRGMRYRHMSVIIQGLLQGGQLKKLSDYHQKGLMEWGVNLLMAPLSWAWHRYISAPPQNEDTYLVVSLIKELCDQVILEHYKSIIHVTTDSLMSHDKFVQLIQRVAKSHDQMSSHVLEHQLLSDGRITKMIISGTNEVIVKLGSNVDSKPSPVSDTDIGIYK
jgi:charged multivesicular body protein 7